MKKYNHEESEMQKALGLDTPMEELIENLEE